MWRTALIVWILCMAAAVGCDRSVRAQSDDTVAAPISIIDSLGRRVTLQKPAVRIASLSPGFTETLFATGCEKQIVVRDVWSDYPDAARRIPAVDGVTLSVAAIAGFQPDLVLLYFKDDRNTRAFAELGIPVAVFDPKNYAQVAATVSAIGTLCGQADAGARIAEDMRRAAAQIRQELSKNPVPPPRVYIEIDATDIARPWTVGSGAFVSELVEMAGGRNAVSHLRVPYAQISAEELIRLDPEMVLLMGVGKGAPDERFRDFASRPGYGSMKAIGNGGMIAGIDADILTRVGPRLVEGLRRLHAEISPRTLLEPAR